MTRTVHSCSSYYSCCSRSRFRSSPCYSCSSCSSSCYSCYSCYCYYSCYCCRSLLLLFLCRGCSNTGRRRAAEKRCDALGPEMGGADAVRHRRV